MINNEKLQLLQSAYPQLSKIWDDSIIPCLHQFIKIPNKSPQFDVDWETHGYMYQAAQLLKQWCQQQPIQGMQIELLQISNRTPLLLIDIEGQDHDDTILLYGHLDKQPEMSGWHAGFGPWQPVEKDGKLYGRGAADDGYSVFAALSAIMMLQQQHIPHARCVVLIEASEESGSIDLPHYLHQLYPRLGHPNLVIGLDSGCCNYEQLWGTTSLRGLLQGNLSIKVLRHGIHSGYGGGVIPSALGILRQLLDRIEDSATGKIHLPALHTPVPEQQLKHAETVAQSLGEEIIKAYPLAAQTQTITSDAVEILLNRGWHPALSVTGLEGFPDIAHSGNVIIPQLKVKLSFRIPPNCEPNQAMQTIKEVLESNPPYQAAIHFSGGECAAGWLAPPLADWLAQANEQASQLFFNRPAMYIGEGGTIPFMGMLAQKFPQAQFLITGVLGPESNAHGPNEFLHIEMAKKLSACVATIIAAHFHRNNR